MAIRLYGNSSTPASTGATTPPIKFSGAQNVAIKLYPDTLRVAANVQDSFKKNPLNLPDKGTLSRISAKGSVLGDSIVEVVNRAKTYAKLVDQRNVPISSKLNAAGRVLTGLVNVGVSPISFLFGLAEEAPVVGNLVKAAPILPTALGETLSHGGSGGLNSLVKQKVISLKTANELRPFVTEATTMAGQFAGYAALGNSPDAIRLGARQLPSNLLYKVKQANIPAADIIQAAGGAEVMVNGKAKPINPEATRFIASLTNPERVALNTTARAALKTDGNVRITTGVEPTALGDFAKIRLPNTGLVRSAPEQQLPGYMNPDARSGAIGNVPRTRVGGEFSIDPLAAEARKYKSAEEFVKATNPSGKTILPSERPTIYKADIAGISPDVKPYKTVGNIQLIDEGTEGIYAKINGEDAGFITKLSEGETDLSVAVEFQKQGLGKILTREWLSRYPEMLYKTGGFTPAGEATYKSVLADIYNKAVGGAPEEYVRERDAIDELISGSAKIRVSGSTATEWKDALGRGRYARTFRVGGHHETIDEFASRVGMSENDLIDGVEQRLREKANAVEAKRRTPVVRAIKPTVMEKVKAAYDKKIAKIKSSKEVLDSRRSFIRAVQKQFGLSDADLKSVTRRDIRLMSNLEFKKFLDDVRVRSEQLAEWNQAKNELMQQVQDKELNIEPLRQAMGLPTIANMKIGQLRQLNDAITPYEKGDVFLSKRKLETIERTELASIKTYREARELLAKKLGIPVESLTGITVKELDRFRGQSSLAEQNPFFEMMVKETAKLSMTREAEYLEIEEKTNALARKMKTTIGQKLIPQQKNIRAWFEASDKSKIELTPAETDLVKFMQDEWIKALDYLVKIKALEKGRKSENYFTHVRRGIMESVKEDGIIQAFKEVFSQYQLDEQGFNILDTQTGEVLALDKFFKFALHRTGGLKPTENIVGAFLTYMRTFKRKQALDEIVPLIDVYAHALTPKGATKEGLLLHGDLIRFTKEWLNTQKGRRITLVAKQGGKLDWALRAGRSLTTWLDIGLNIPVTVFTQIGEQAVNFQLSGLKRYALGKVRAVTPKGRRITAKYRNVIGKNPWTQLIEPMRNIGDRLSEGVFLLFRDANVRRNRNFLLGEMTPAEWATETISPARLAELQLDAGRYGVVDGAGSIVGATPEAGVLTQYKSWALPILGSQLRNIKYMSQYVLSGGKNKDPRSKRAFKESARMLELGLFVLIVGAWAIDQKDDSFVGKMKQRAYTEALTLYGSWTSVMTTPRMISFLTDLSDHLVSIMKLETYKDSRFGSYQAGDLKGLNQLESQFTPKFIKQFQSDKIKTKEDVKAEIKAGLKDGSLSMPAAKALFVKEMQSIKDAELKTKFTLPKDQYKADLKKRLTDGTITVADAKKEFLAYAKENADSLDSADEGTFIDKVKVYAKALGTDPVTAIEMILTNESIRRLDNGTIIVKRMTKDQSEQVKKERGAVGDLKLDHTVPLELGGSNSDSNLKLISNAEWLRYTPVENYLGNKLRAGLITGDEAQSLIKKFKKGEIQESDIMN